MAAIIDDGAKPIRPAHRTRGWLGAFAIALVLALFLWATWPAGGASAMTAEDFKQMYEGATSGDAEFPPPVFP